MNNNFAAQYPSKFQRDPYLMPQQPGQQLMDETTYREQPQMTRDDWSQMIQQQQLQIEKGKQGNLVWPEKLAKQTPNGGKTGRKKVSNKDSEYSEEYLGGDESQADGDDSTTTEAPKKVNHKYCSRLRIVSIIIVAF